MEPVSSASAVISLGSQILSGALDVYNFISKMRNGRNDIENIAAELVVLTRVLDGVDLFGESHVQSLCNCLNKVQELNDLVGKARSQGTSKNPLKQLRASFSYARKAEAWKRLEELLAHAKLTLLMAMAQRTIDIGEDLQNSASNDRRLHESNFEALHGHNEQIRAALAQQDRSQQYLVDALARQGAANHAAILSRFDALDMHISCCLSTTAVDGRIPEVRWKQLSAEIARMTGKIQDDVLRVNIRRTIWDSMRSHFEAIVSDQNPDLALTPVTVADPFRDPLPLIVSPQPRGSQKFQSFKRYFFGDICIVTDTFRTSTGRTEIAEHLHPFITRSVFMFHPSRLTILRGLQNRIEVRLEERATQGWEYTIRYFNSVPANAPIFKFCAQGDIAAVQKLFSSGEASPWDVNEDGWSPLHYAAQYRHTKLCRLLLDNNGDSCALTYPKSYGSVFIPFDLAWLSTIYAGREPNGESESLDLIRCFVDSTDYSQFLHSSHIDLESILSVIDLKEASDNPPPEPGIKVLHWFLQNCLRDEMLEARTRRTVMNLTFHAATDAFRLSDFDYGKKVLQGLLSAADLDLNRSTTPDGAMLLHWVLSGNVVSQSDDLKLLLSAGANPHLPSNAGKSCNPTQVALQHADTFHMWRGAIINLGFDLTKFVEESFRQPCWMDSGWTKEAVLDMFDTGFALVFMFPYSNSLSCWICGLCWYRTRCQWWNTVIQQIKAGGDRPIMKYSRFVNVSEPPESFACDVERILLADLGSDEPELSFSERIIYKSIWRHYMEMRATCLICLARIRNLALSAVLQNSNPSDTLAIIKSTIQPDIEGPSYLKSRWDIFQERLEHNWPHIVSEVDDEAV